MRCLRSLRSRFIHGLAVVVASALCASVRADGWPRLSARGNQLLGGSLGGSWSNDAQPERLLYRSPAYTVWLQPSWIYFVRDRIGLGFYLGYELERDSSPFNGRTARQTAPNPNGSTSTNPFVKPPLEHDISVGVAGALELLSSGRVALFARPYVGFAAQRSYRYVSSAPPSFGVLDPNLVGSANFARRTVSHWGVFPQAGLRLPCVYQASPRLGFGFGPDFGWERVQGDRSLTLGVSTWIVRVF